MKILQLVFLFGAFALLYSALRPYPPLSADTVLVALFAICLTVGGILFTADGDEGVTAKYLLASLLPWLLAALFLANGALDDSNEIRYQTVVVDSHYGRWTHDEVVVRSWRSGRTNESFYLSPIKRFFHHGEPITVGVKSGALGISWISSISR